MALIDKLTALADAIRSKTGKTEKLTLDQMVVEINSLRQTPMYTVRFLNGDVVLQTSQVREGETPVFVGENPTPEPDFAFVGWLPEIAPVTGDVDYVAQFKSTKSVARAIINKSITEYSNNTITSVGSQAFYGCTSLVFVSMPNVITLGSSVFDAVPELSTVSVPNVEKIGTASFNSCPKVENLYLPKLKDIGVMGFNGCSNVKSITLPAAPPKMMGATLFGTIHADCVFHIPAGSLSAYQNDTNWSTLTGQYTFTEDA